LIVLLDACVVIDFLRSLPAARTVLSGEKMLAASEVTRFEVLAGLRPGEEGATEAFFQGIAWLEIDENVARQAAALARQYRPSHSGIDAADYLIAATALEYGARLLTTNVRHFPMLPGLEPAY
jgi:predicted nucleic acid-binding protein